jgi:hypothetical protein
MGLTIAFVKLLFDALAALMLPHMVLVERVRFSGWQRPAVASPMPP